MSIPLKVLACALLLQSGFTKAGEPSDIIDSGGKLTKREIVLALVATAQEVEDRCGMTGLLPAAIQMINASDTSIDLNDEANQLSVRFFLTNIRAKANSVGTSQWCQDNASQLSKMLNVP